MILFQIFKFDFVSNVKKFRFRNSHAKQRTHIDILKNSNSKRKQVYLNKAEFLWDCIGKYFFKLR